jgi:hypothetical protein
MKRCPECKRDYYDDSLMYCLDDGSGHDEGLKLFSLGEIKKKSYSTRNLNECNPTYNVGSKSLLNFVFQGQDRTATGQLSLRRNKRSGTTARLALF